VTQAQARAAALQTALGTSTRALVITEGLLLYLDETQVRDLGADLTARAQIQSWILDLASPELLEMMRKSMGSNLANAQLRFAAPNGVAYFELLGWKVTYVCSILHAAARFRRLPWFLRVLALLPEANPRRLGRSRWSGVVRLERGASGP